MWSMLKNLWKTSAPLRFVYNCVAIISMAFTVFSLTYYGYFEHRIWVNERLADSYAHVESEQTKVVKLILSTVPSRATADRAPTQEEVALLRDALTELAGRVSGVDATSEEIISASNAYRGSIAELSGALVRYSADDPSSHGELLLAVDRWDVAANNYARVLEKRIGRFKNTLLPSV